MWDCNCHTFRTETNPSQNWSKHLLQYFFEWGVESQAISSLASKSAILNVENGENIDKWQKMTKNYENNECFAIAQQPHLRVPLLRNATNASTKSLQNSLKQCTIRRWLSCKHGSCCCTDPIDPVARHAQICPHHALSIFHMRYRDYKLSSAIAFSRTPNELN